jgi:hypothetical protein
MSVTPASRRRCPDCDIRRLFADRCPRWEERRELVVADQRPGATRRTRRREKHAAPTESRN